MCPMWNRHQECENYSTPNISQLSKDGQTVLKAYRRWKLSSAFKEEDHQNNICKDSGHNYYSSIYQKSFGSNKLFQPTVFDNVLKSTSSGKVLDCSPMHFPLKKINMMENSNSLNHIKTLLDIDYNLESLSPCSTEVNSFHQNFQTSSLSSGNYFPTGGISNVGAVNDPIVPLEEQCAGILTSNRHAPNASEKGTFNKSSLDGEHEKSIDKKENSFGSVLPVLEPSPSWWTIKNTDKFIDSPNRKRNHSSGYFQQFSPKPYNTNQKHLKKSEDKRDVITEVEEVQNMYSPDLCMKESESIVDKDDNNTVIENSATPFLQNGPTENTSQNECFSSLASFLVNFDLCFSPGFCEESPLPDVNKNICGSMQEQKDSLCLSSSKQVSQILELKDKEPIHSEDLKESDSKSYIVNVTDKKDTRIAVVGELQGGIQTETEILAINNKKTNTESERKLLKFSVPYKLQDQKGSVLLEHWIQTDNAPTKLVGKSESSKQVFEIIKEINHKILLEIKNAQIICILMCSLDETATIQSQDETLTVLIKWMDGQEVKKDFYTIPLTPINEGARNLVIHILSSEAVVVSFSVKNLISCLVTKLKIDYRTVIRQWRVHDIKIAAWLLNAEKVPETIADFKEIFHLDEVTDSGDTYKVSSTISNLENLQKFYSVIKDQLKEQNLFSLFVNVEVKLIPVLSVMELRGIKVNKNTLLEEKKILQERIQEVKKEAYKVAGREFSINSYPQLRQVLFDELKLDSKLQKITLTTVNNLRSTCEAVLEALKNCHPLPQLILEYRHLVKVKSTYVDGLISHIKNDILCTTWDQTAAVTGRLSSANPNLLFSGPDQKVLRIRDPFISQEGWSLLAADFQQIELRLLAHFCQDKKLINAFRGPNYPDIFIQLTSLWLKKPLEYITSVEREKTKRIVYSVMYGVGKVRLASYLSIPENEAETVIENFLNRFPGIKQFTKKCITECKKTGYVCSILKRRRVLPYLNSMNHMLRMQAERQAVNFLIQGSAADICKSAMVEVENEIAAHTNLHARLLVQLHDELLWEVPDVELEATKCLVKKVMEDTGRLLNQQVILEVPITVSLSVGKTWGGMSSLPT
ncbi:uncharacterized protein LOC143253370 isoform X2 [Tachypleus tridentatus]|uniref:uncharacterized protein LOC143253370 isoform X2 n=1 Tax=Tachypleus tridentatus TaxID=6853 RepID=UPI003FD29736